MLGLPSRLGYEVITADGMGRAQGYTARMVTVSLNSGMQKAYHPKDIVQKDRAIFTMEKGLTEWDHLNTREQLSVVNGMENAPQHIHNMVGKQWKALSNEDRSFLLDILKGDMEKAEGSEIKKWITVRGAHVPIKDGQSEGDAVKGFLEKKGGSKKTEDGKKSDSTYDRAVSKVDAFEKKNRASGKPMVGSKEANEESDARKRKEDDAFISNDKKDNAKKTESGNKDSKGKRTTEDTFKDMDAALKNNDKEAYVKAGLENASLTNRSQVKRSHIEGEWDSGRAKTFSENRSKNKGGDTDDSANSNSAESKRIESIRKKNREEGDKWEKNHNAKPEAYRKEYQKLMDSANRTVNSSKYLSGDIDKDMHKERTKAKFEKLAIKYGVDDSSSFGDKSEKKKASVESKDVDHSEQHKKDMAEIKNMGLKGEALSEAKQDASLRSANGDTNIHQLNDKQLKMQNKEYYEKRGKERKNSPESKLNLSDGYLQDKYAKMKESGKLDRVVEYDRAIKKVLGDHNPVPHGAKGSLVEPTKAQKKELTKVHEKYKDVDHTDWSDWRDMNKAISTTDYQSGIKMMADEVMCSGGAKKGSEQDKKDKAECDKNGEIARMMDLYAGTGTTLDILPMNVEEQKVKRVIGKYDPVAKEKRQKEMFFAKWDSYNGTMQKAVDPHGVLQENDGSHTITVMLDPMNRVVHTQTMAKSVLEAVYDDDRVLVKASINPVA